MKSAKYALSNDKNFAALIIEQFVRILKYARTPFRLFRSYWLMNSCFGCVCLFRSFRFFRLQMLFICLITKKPERSKQKLWLNVSTIRFEFRYFVSNSSCQLFSNDVNLFLVFFSFTTELLISFLSTSMIVLIKTKPFKIYFAVKVTILNKYINFHDIFKWSEIGILIRKNFRAFVISQLKSTKNDDVAKYFKLHELEINEFFHRKIKFLRKQNDENQFWKKIFEVDFTLTKIDRSFYFNEQFNKFHWFGIWYIKKL